MAVLKEDTTIGGVKVVEEINLCKTTASTAQSKAESAQSKADAAKTKADAAFPSTGGTISGDVRIQSDSFYGRKLNFGDADYVYLYEPTDDFLEIKGSKGIALNGTITSTVPTTLKTNEVKFVYS